MKIEIEFVKNGITDYKTIEIDADIVEYIRVDGEGWRSIWDY